MKLTLEAVGETEFEQLWVANKDGSNIFRFWLSVDEDGNFEDPLLAFARLYWEANE